MIALGSYFAQNALNRQLNIQHVSEVCRCSCTHHFHIDHNACCLPTKILYSHCLRFLFGRLQYSGNYGYVKFGGKQGALWSM